MRAGGNGALAVVACLVGKPTPGVKGDDGSDTALPMLAGKVRRDDVFVWDHETDSRARVAPTLVQYSDWWLSGRLTG